MLSRGVIDVDSLKTGSTNKNNMSDKMVARDSAAFAEPRDPVAVFRKQIRVKKEQESAEEA